MRFFHTALSVKSIEISRRFYETVFGLTYRTGAERPELGIKFINLQDDREMVLELFEHVRPMSGPHDLMDMQRIGIKHISFIVENIEQAIERVLQNGGTLIRPTQAGKTVRRNAFVGDPDGIPIELVEL